MFSLIQNGTPSSQYVPYLPSQIQPTTLSSNNDKYKFTTFFILPYPILSTKSIKTNGILFRFDDIISNIEDSYILTRQGRNEKSTAYKQSFVKRRCYEEEIMFENIKQTS